MIYAYDLATINSENFINKGQIYTNSLEIYNSYDFINLNSVLNAKNHLEIYTNNLISKNSDFLSKSGAILSNNTKLIHSNLNNVDIYTKLFFNKNSKFQNLNIINQILKTDSDLFANIFQSNLNIKEKEKILSEFITSYAKNFGYFNYINVVLLNTYQDGASNSQFLGNFNTNTPNTIYVNLAYINNPIKLTNALGHELYHLISFSRHSFIANDKSQDIEANKQGYLLSYYLNENLKTKRPLYKYPNIKTAHSDKQILDNEEFFKELDKYNSDNAAPIVVPLGMQVLKSTFKSSFVKKITKEQVDRLTKAIIIKCINCHGADVYKTGKKFDTDLTNALDKKGYHNKFTKELFKLAGIKFDNSDLIEKQNLLVPMPKNNDFNHLKNVYNLQVDIGDNVVTPDINNNDFEKTKVDGQSGFLKNKKDGSIWSKDRNNGNGHGGSAWKRYPNEKSVGSQNERRTISKEGKVLRK